MAVEIISLSISTKVWDRAGIELATPGSAVRLASVARHVTDCATRPGQWLTVLRFPHLAQGAIKLFMGMINFQISCSTEFNLKFIMLINVKMPTVVSMVNTLSDNYKP